MLAASGRRLMWLPAEVIGRPPFRRARIRSGCGAARQSDAMDEDERDALWIAPDALHKAGTSGGDPYAIAVPDLRIDGELLDEPHALMFVEYLRLRFRFGGFPGYDGQIAVPAEIDRLTADLVPF
jgi:hypothetical protein